MRQTMELRDRWDKGGIEKINRYNNSELKFQLLDAISMALCEQKKKSKSVSI